MTNKQQKEIEFLCTHFGGEIKDAEDYIQATVHGISDTEDKFSSNSLRIAKTKLDRNIKMWREDLDNGLLLPWELEEEFGASEFGKKLIKSVIESTHQWHYYYSNPVVAFLAAKLSHII